MTFCSTTPHWIESNLLSGQSLVLQVAGSHPVLPFTNRDYMFPCILTVQCPLFTDDGVLQILFQGDLNRVHDTRPVGFRCVPRRSVTRLNLTIKVDDYQAQSIHHGKEIEEGASTLSVPPLLHFFGMDA